MKFVTLILALFYASVSAFSAQQAVTYNTSTLQTSPSTANLRAASLTTSSGSVAGTVTLTEGTAQSLTANAFSIYPPTDVASGGLAWVLPGAAFSGLIKVTDSSGVGTLVQAVANTDYATPSITMTIAGTANEITSSAGAQSLAANRTWTLSLPTALTFTGKTITGGSYVSPTFTDVTTGNVSTSAHGLAPKGDGDTSKFLNANGGYSTPSGGGGGSATNVIKTITCPVSGGGIAITIGEKGTPIPIKENLTVTGWTIMCDQSGSVVFDVWLESDPYDAGGVLDNAPTVADTITAAAKPTLSSQRGKTSTTLTGWTTSLAAGSALTVNVDSASTVTRATLFIHTVTN